MSHQQAMARVYVYDVATVIDALDKHCPHDVSMGRWSYEYFIDGFFKWALDSFQFLGIRDARIDHFTQDILFWYNQQDNAKHKLWELFSIEESFAGREAFIVRHKTTLWIFVLV